jgi:hypothetical protein
MPLQEFWPLHDDDAVLHALVPLQELMPLHFTPSAALAVDAAAPIANKSAAEATRRARAVMENSLASTHSIPQACLGMRPTGSHRLATKRDPPITST